MNHSYFQKAVNSLRKCFHGSVIPLQPVVGEGIDSSTAEIDLKKSLPFEIPFPSLEKISVPQKTVEVLNEEIGTCVVAAEKAHMWDVTFKYQFEYKCHGSDKPYTCYKNAGVKCVATTAEQACALVKAFKPNCVILGVHHRAGGNECRILINQDLLPPATSSMLIHKELKPMLSH